MQTKQEFEKNPLFNGISPIECQEMLSCFQAIRRNFRVDEPVYDFTSETLGIVEHGEAVLLRIDEEGVSTVLETFGPGGVFGKSLAFAGAVGDSLEVVCQKPCEVLFLDYSHIFNRCEHACLRHSVLVQNMLQLMASKAQALSQRVDVLSRRSIREKLLCYFRQLVNQTGERTFILPFSLSVLADYIATDRSAMMRELKHLREEGIVHSEGRRFTLR